MAKRPSIVRPAFIILLAGLFLSALPGNVGSADACWCRSNRINEVIDSVEHVFTFEVTELVVVDDENAIAFGDVREVFKGTVESRVRVGLRWGKICLDPQLLDVGARLGAIGSKGKYKARGVCEAVDAAAAVRAAIEPVSQPENAEPPKFIRPDAGLGVRVAYLDERLRPTHFGAGLGRVVEFAVCPGGKKVLELVVGSAQKESATVETRDIASLNVEFVQTLGHDRRAAARFRDFECHEENGRDFSYLDYRGRGAAGIGAVVEIWRGGEQQRVSAGGAVAASVDLAAEIVHVLKPAPDLQVETWSIGEAERLSVVGLPEMKPVDLEVAPGTGIVTVLGGSTDAKVGARANGFLVQIVAGQLRTERIAEAARPLAMEFFGDELYTVVTIRGEGRAYQLREPDGGLIGDVLLPNAGAVDFAFSDGTLAVRTSSSEYRAFAKHIFKATQRVDRAGAIEALPAGSVAEITVGDLPPVLDVSASIVEGGPLPPSRRPVREPTSQRWALAIAAAVVLAAGAGVAVSVRRRRTAAADDGWMA